MQSRILGTTMPVIEFTLDPNESVISEAGELSWMTSSIQMTTHTQFAGAEESWRAEARGRWRIAVHDGIPRHRRPWRDLLRHQTARAYRADRSRRRTRIHDSPARIFVRHAADSDQRRFPAIARGRIFGGDGFLLQHVSGRAPPGSSFRVSWS